MKYTKLDALKILSQAYHYLVSTTGPSDATYAIADKFGYVRRSLRLEDLEPKVDTEGFNGRMPQFF